MRVSLEYYLLVNFFMNLMTIGICARGAGRVQWAHVTFASAFGAIYAAAMLWKPFALLSAWPMRLVLLVLLSAASMRVDRPRDVLSGAMRLAGGTCFVGGMMGLARQALGGQSRWGLYAAAPLAGIALLAAIDARNRKLDKWGVQLWLRTRRGSARLSALIDTGNRLREPLSGLPVLIVEARAVAKLLPPGFDPAGAARMLPPGFRVARYGGLGGNGQMICFRPDDVYASYGQGWVRAPDVWVGLYPGRMPGAVRALAPPVIGRVQPADAKFRTGS
ncbi:MAG: hypothetical protein GX558_08960 [Clostridiales bacterium]|nr:hypothetical protein [Clostridiales bacterium]